MLRGVARLIIRRTICWEWPVWLMARQCTSFGDHWIGNLSKVSFA
jgi:hypothetical protein